MKQYSNLVTTLNRLKYVFHMCFPKIHYHIIQFVKSLIHTNKIIIIICTAIL